MRRATPLSVLVGILFALLTLGAPGPAVAAPLQDIELSPAAPARAPFSLVLIAGLPLADQLAWHSRSAPAATARPAMPPRRALFGYPSAHADELAEPAAQSATENLLFTHAALGVALLDATPAENRAEPVRHAGAGSLDAGQLNLTMPPPPQDPLPSPLPIALIVVMVLLPAGLVLGQALIGVSRRPRVVLWRRDR